MSCYKLDNCQIIDIIMDKDMPDFLVAEAIRNVCSKCSIPDRKNLEI